MYNDISEVYSRWIVFYELYENIISKEKSLKKKTDNSKLNIIYDKELNLIKKF